MQKLLRVGRIGVVLGIIPWLSRCGGSDLVLPSEIVPAAITKVDGDKQSAVVGGALDDSLVAKVLDQRGDPLPGVRVAFAPGAGADGAVVRPAVATTNSEGLAKAQWVLGTTGGAQSVVATVADTDGLEVTFEASARPGEPHRIEQGGGDQQDGRVGDVLADPLVVLVEDEFGNPVEGVAVAWSTGDGSVDPASSTTGADGKASTNWRLGSAPGGQSAAATVEGLDGSPVTFTATAGPGGASRLVLVSGNNQSGNPGQELSQPLVVRLEDADGNGVSGRAVSWVVGSGGGDVNANTSSTDADGEAQVRWTLGSNSGLNTLNAVVSGVGFVTFRATATGGGGGGGNGGGGNGDGGNGGGGGGDNGGGGGSSPARLHFVVQPSDADRGKKITPAIQVEVLDQAGGRVTQQDFEINLELLGDNGKLKGHNREKTRSGVATFADIKVDKEGEYRLRAAADGLPSLDSDAFEIHEDHEHHEHGGGHGRH